MGHPMSLLRAISGAACAQLQLTRQNVEDLRPLLTMPLLTLVSLAVLTHSGRTEYVH
jgi:hypothetical protein